MDTNKAKFRHVHSCAACNRNPGCLDWGKNNIIIYGVCNSVVLYKPKDDSGGNIIETLISHSKSVTSVHWINVENGLENELISTSVDNTAVIWSNVEDSFQPTVLKGHTNAVKTACAVYTTGQRSDDLLIATASIDATVKLWKRKNGIVECIQTLDFGYGFATGVKLVLLDDDENAKVPLLAIATDDFKIRLYAADGNNKFNHLSSLIGHEDWVQGLDFVKDKEDLLLCSGAQDCFIRIWRMSTRKITEELAPSLKVKEIELKLHTGKAYYVSLESILSGHENWIYSVKWKAESTEGSPLQLLSTSMDKTMIVWQMDLDSHLWQDKVRVGDVGGNTLGFYGGVFSPCGSKILAHSYQGAIHMWRLNKVTDFWEPGVAFSGHFAPVRDISWDPEGAYLLSCSEDQTSRLFAPWLKDASNVTPETWHELSRPQIHGYDMVCLSSINRYKFVSGGDEKIFRIFEAPRSFAESLKSIAGIDSSTYLLDSLPEGASVPSLGLSNKAVFEKDIEKAKNADKEERHAKDVYPDFYYTPVDIKEPPAEELLLQNTLWPENQKLYGHPYEVYAVAANSKGTIIASACKASKLEHAAIILWDASSGKQIGQLPFHVLTVTQLEFSPDDQYLLSVSRDRTWAVYRHFPNENPMYRKICNLEKKSTVHTRIIWSCTWSHDSLYFCTSSRDKKVAVWGSQSENNFSLASQPLEVEDSPTAVGFAPCLLDTKCYTIAVGLENGRIHLCTWDPSVSTSAAWNIAFVIDKNHAHHLTINRIKFAPKPEANAKELLMASCGNDHLIRIYGIQLAALLEKS